MKIVVIKSQGLIIPGEEKPGNQESSESLNARLSQYAKENGISLELVCESGEGELVTAIQKALGADGVILDAGEYSFYSIAIRDAISSIKNTPVIELQAENAADGRQSVLSAVCAGVISGFGQNGYILAMDGFKNRP